jgi:hypothetical protein
MERLLKHLAVMVALIAGFSAGSVIADDLGEAATNPVSNLIQFRMQNAYTPSNYNADSWGNAATIQTVVPLPSVSDRFDSLKGIVTRTTAAYVSTPELNGVGRKHAMGDTNFLGFAVPKAAPKKTVWGIGPAINIPTAGDNNYTGSGSWQVGPAAVVMVTPMKGLQVGALVFHQWDVYDIRSDAPDVSKTFIQPILTKHFDKGWYVSLPDQPQAYDWEEENWTLNLGAVLGRVFPVGGQPMQIFGGVYYNSEDNDDIPAAEWTFKFQVGWLFPQ